MIYKLYEFLKKMKQEKHKVTYNNCAPHLKELLRLISIIKGNNATEIVSNQDTNAVILKKIHEHLQNGITQKEPGVTFLSSSMYKDYQKLLSEFEKYLYKYETERSAERLSEILILLKLSAESISDLLNLLEEKSIDENNDPARFDALANFQKIKKLDEKPDVKTVVVSKDESLESEMKVTKKIEKDLHYFYLIMPLKEINLQLVDFEESYKHADVRNYRIIKQIYNKVFNLDKIDISRSEVTASLTVAFDRRALYQTNMFIACVSQKVLEGVAIGKATNSDRKFIKGNVAIPSQEIFRVYFESSDRFAENPNFNSQLNEDQKLIQLPTDSNANKMSV